METPIESWAITPFDIHGKPLPNGPEFHRFEPIHPQYDDISEESETE